MKAGPDIPFLEWYMPWPCVCVSVTSQSSTKTAKHRMMQTMPHDSKGLEFSDANSFRNSNGSPPTGAPNAGRVGRSWQTSTNNLPYLENGMRETHSFY